MKRDIDYRKLIIERKERVLKELNQKVLNRFIDKLYAQEIVIDDLQRRLSTLRKLQNNLCNSTSNNSNNNVNTNWKSKHPTLNIVIPKDTTEFSGTIAFMSKTHNIKNINKFINVKSSSSFMPSKSNSHCNSSSNLNKNGVIKKSVSLGNIMNANGTKQNSRKNSKCRKNSRANNVSDIKKAILSQTTKRTHSTTNMTVPKKAANTFCKDNNCLLDTSVLGNNLSYINLFNHNITHTPSARSSSRDNNMVRNPSRQTQELLDKSYKVVHNYEKTSKFKTYSEFMSKASALKHKTKK